MDYDLKKMTRQEVFNAVVDHLLTQKKKSGGVDHSDVCLYRGPENTRCAAGIFISDSAYNESEYEDNTWMELIEKEKVPSKHGQLVSDMQTIHDNLDAIDWEKALVQYAEKHKLSFNWQGV